jgi:general secretion pathway protein I
VKYSRGFTVLEVVIAFAILSMATLAIYEAIGHAMSSYAKLGSVEPALTLAESLLAENSINPIYETADRDGTEGSLSWSVHTVPYYSQIPGAIPLVSVRVRVTWAPDSPRNRIELAQLAMARYPNQEPRDVR